MMSVRELTFDRFIIPAFALKGVEGDLYEVTKDGLMITTDGNTKEFLFEDYPIMDSLTTALLEEGIILAYTPYFNSAEPSSTLIVVKEASMEGEVTLYRRYFFSDETIKKEIQYYYLRVLHLNVDEIIDDLVGKLKRPSERHLTIWTSYQLVNKRRLYENASEFIGMTFSDGSGYEGGGGSTLPITTTVNIGSVFSITEDSTQGYFVEDFNRVGSDNTWGDRYSFWYKLMLYLRDLLEDMFGDYSLRKDNVIPGTIDLLRPLDFRAYYDSWPWTLSPLSRGIVTKTP